LLALTLALAHPLARALAAPEARPAVAFELPRALRRPAFFAFALNVALSRPARTPAAPERPLYACGAVYKRAKHYHRRVATCVSETRYDRGRRRT
jgi:hypothetical protein